MSVARGGHQQDRPPSLVDRVRRARGIAAERAKTDKRGKLAPTPWSAIGEKFGPSERQARRIYEDFCRWERDQHDPLATVDEAIMLHEAARDHLGELAVSGDNSSAQVGAAKAMLDADRERLELMQAVGRLPRNLHRFRAEADVITIAREMVEVMRKRGVLAEVLQEIRDVAERQLPQFSVNATGARPSEPLRPRVAVRYSTPWKKIARRYSEAPNNFCQRADARIAFRALDTPELR